MSETTCHKKCPYYVDSTLVKQNDSSEAYDPPRCSFDPNETRYISIGGKCIHGCGKPVTKRKVRHEPESEPTSKCLIGTRSHSDMTCGTCGNCLPCRHPYLKDRPVCLYGANPTCLDSRCSAVVDDDMGQSMFCWVPSLEAILPKAAEIIAYRTLTKKEKQAISDIIFSRKTTKTPMDVAFDAAYYTGVALYVKFITGDGANRTPKVQVILSDQNGNEITSLPESQVFDTTFSIEHDGVKYTLELLAPNGQPDIDLTN